MVFSQAFVSAVYPTCLNCNSWETKQGSKSFACDCLSSMIVFRRSSIQYQLDVLFAFVLKNDLTIIRFITAKLMYFIK